MATYKTGWLRLPSDPKDFKERFAWSHVKAIFYDKARNILLKDKLDAMDKLISDHADAIANKLMTNDAFNTAIADYVTKAMMSSTQVNDANHVPTSSLAYAMQQAITANANAITQLNSELWPRNSGTFIEAGTDMYTIKTPGRYYCSSNAVVATLKNCPLNEAFTLVVYFSTGYPSKYFSQEYTSYIGNRRIIQNYNADTATWKKYEFQITMK